ncbi:medium chain dehydrogenase/reductase family protein [Streptomyces flavofungini]|uniref:medium chain dehydrogenase/reductase family protein n=1 Tax=Streptomyces flavofungini TaxID=68200 RepID=UPI0025AEFB98|nr:medium chain dehydrogenase/reductase family protein [Streptomyces flavofungini]WJV48973.1 medium chain dehydrogenase/reductase family protein [Streptomyces flavofungini]
MRLPTRTTHAAHAVARIVLRSRAHWLLSGRLLLISYASHPSGPVRTVPVRYARSTDGDVIHVLVGDARLESWWRALRPSAPVRLRLRDREVAATADVLDSAVLPHEARDALRLYRRRFPWARVPHGGVVVVRLRPHRPGPAPHAGEAANHRIVVTRHGGPRTLQLITEAVPEPGYGEVRVAVTAAEVNFTDALLREGVYPGGPKPPFTPGYDLVGVIDELGPGVLGWSSGQRVAALTVYGAYTGHICLPTQRLVPLPSGLDPLRALGLLLSYVTAYQLLHRVARVRKGERVLVQGAAGAVGIAALQLGPRDGLEMYGTAAGATTEQVAALGATPVDYTREDVAARVRALTDGGADVVLDGIGGRTAWDSFRALRPGGRLVLFGHHAALSHGRRSLARTLGFHAVGALLFAATALPSHKHVTTYRIAELRDRHPDWYRQDLDELFRLLDAGEISPPPVTALPLARAAQAHRRLGQGHLSGKYVLLCHPCRSIGPRHALADPQRPGDH